MTKSGKVQPDIAREFGVRTDVPWRDLDDWERDIVLGGPEEKKEITSQPKKACGTSTSPSATRG